MDVKNSNPNPNPNPCNPNLAFHFLTSLARINQSSTGDRRSRSISRAAYASMAYAAGPRRAWGRALLRRLLGRRSRRAVLIRRRVRIARSAQPREADDLRRVVPGGKGMDLCNLLEETADYIQSLSAQVKLMEAMVDSASHQIP